MPTPRRSTTTPSAFTVTVTVTSPCDTSSTASHCAAPTPPRNTTALPALHRPRRSRDGRVIGSEREKREEKDYAEDAKRAQQPSK
ncbi:hypothetical protein CISIN_1g0341712mg, partial [Citrus sinensis]